MTVDVLMIGLRSVGAMQGGVESHVNHLARELDNLGLNVAVSVRTPYAPPGQTFPGTRVHVVRIWSPRSVAFEAIVHSFLSVLYAAVIRPRIVHIHAIGPSVVTPMARLLGLRVVTTHHGEDFRREKWGRMAKFILRCGEIFQAKFANGLICVSKSLSAHLSAHYRRTFTYIPNGVVKPESLPSSGVLSELGLTPGGYIVTVSRLVPEKRHLDLIAAFKILNRSDMKLVLVGAADHQTPYSETVVRDARQTPGVILAGFRNGAALQDLYNNAAIFSLPSTHEGLPIALLEAMAHGCEVIVSDIPPHLDLELPPENYHEVGNPADLSLKISRLLAASENGPRRDWTAMLQPFKWERIGAKSLEIYRAVDDRVGRHGA